MVGEAIEVGGADPATALWVAAGAFEFRFDIQGAVIVGNLVPGLDIADSDSRSKPSASDVGWQEWLTNRAWSQQWRAMTYYICVVAPHS
jgi:hypothetical protein